MTSSMLSRRVSHMNDLRRVLSSSSSSSSSSLSFSSVATKQYHQQRLLTKTSVHEHLFVRNYHIQASSKYDIRVTEKSLGQNTRRTATTANQFFNGVSNRNLLRFNHGTGAKNDDIVKSIQESIDNNKVVIYSKTYCPFCHATKSLFQSMQDVDAEIIELDEMGETGSMMQNELYIMTGQRTVPNVFVNGQHVGGNDNVQEAARTGRLQEMLK